MFTSHEVMVLLTRISYLEKTAQPSVQADGSRRITGSPVILDDTLAKDETRMFRRR